MSPSSMQPKPETAQSRVYLTARELQILPMLFMTNEQIGAELGTSRHTVGTQVTRLLCKLGLRNRTAAAAWWATEQFMGRGATGMLTPRPPQTVGDDPVHQIRLLNPSLEARGQCAGQREAEPSFTPKHHQAVTNGAPAGSSPLKKAA